MPNNPLFYILLLGILLRLINLNQSLWLDEATSVLVASRLSFSDIINQFSPGDFHPPAYYLILKIWLTLFGSSEIMARSLSVLFGTVTIYLVYSLSERLFGKKTALVSALLIATSPLHIYYSQEARMYVLETLIVVKILQLIVKVVTGEDNSLNWVSLFAFSSLLLYTDYLPASIFVAVFLFLLLNRGALRQKIVLWVSLSAAIAISYLPWLPVLQLQMAVGALAKVEAPGWWEALGKTDFKQLALIPLKFVVGRVTSYNKTLYYFLSSVPVALYSLVIARALTNWRKTSLIWLWLLVPLATAAILGLYVSVFSYFRFLFVLPAFYILAAVGTQSLGGKFGRAAVVLLVICNLAASLIYLTDSRFHREDWRSAVLWVEEHSEKGRAASVFVTKNQRDSYFYYQKDIPSYGPVGWEEADFTKIWLFRYVQPIFDAKEETKQKIESLGYKKRGEKDFNGIVVWEYAK